MSSQKPLSSISLDLDNEWSYLKIHGNSDWDKYPSYFDIFVPLVLDELDSLNLKITFFIVGKDAEISSNEKYLKQIVERGHEVGNHSFNHESWLNQFGREKVEFEILKAEEIIEKITGQKTIGFRGPGFSWSKTILKVLLENKYLYDASTLPTYIGPLARSYYFWTSNLSKEEKKIRKNLFGTFKDGLRSTKPYKWNLNNGKKLLEIPVTTIPLIKIPFHLSYLLYLSRFSSKAMHGYLNTAIAACKITNTQPSFLLHPLDLVGGDQAPRLAFFPGMDLDTKSKLKVFREVIGKLSDNFSLVNMSTHAKSIRNSKNLRLTNVN
ncbi:MAG: polysaccharide deacetylase family protein [Ignavibacteriaceae bacterium]